MIRWLFAQLEVALGPSLGPAAQVVYVAGLVLVALVVARAWWAALVARGLAKAGLARLWTAPCPSCRERQPLRGATCVRCGTKVAISLPARLQLGGSGRTGLVARLLVFGGAILVTAAAALFVLATRALSPAGDLHRLFLGLSLVGFAVVAGAVGGVAGGGGGLFSRAGAGLRALAAVGVTAITLFLADQSRPVDQQDLLRIAVVNGEATFQGGEVALQDGEVAVDYLQVDHAALGFHHVVPLAVHGAGRVDLKLARHDRWLVDWLVRNADALEQRGLAVRRRTDRRTVVAGGVWELRAVNGQVGIHRAGAP